MSNRNINMNGGNYNEQIHGDYVQGKSITREEITINGKTHIKETITTNNNGDIHTVSNNFSKEDKGPFEIVDNIADALSKIKSSVKRSTQIVQGNGNQVIQSGRNSINIQSAKDLHIGDNISQVVQGNGNTVSQSMFTNMRVNGDISIGDVSQVTSQSASTKASNFKNRVEEELPDFWIDEDDDFECKDPRRETFLDVFLPQVCNLTKESSNKEYLESVIEVIEYFDNAPMILHYVVENKKSLGVYMLEEHGKIASNLFSKLIKNLEE